MKKFINLFLLISLTTLISQFLNLYFVILLLGSISLLFIYRQQIIHWLEERPKAYYILSNLVSLTLSALLFYYLRDLNVYLKTFLSITLILNFFVFMAIIDVCYENRDEEELIKFFLVYFSWAYLFLNFGLLVLFLNTSLRTLAYFLITLTFVLPLKCWAKLCKDECQYIQVIFFTQKYSFLNFVWENKINKKILDCSYKL